MSMEFEIQAVIFDLDGLMVNTEDVFHIALTEMMIERGRQLTPECHREMIGRRPLEAFSNLIRILRLEDAIEDLMEQCRARFESLLPTHLRLMPGLTQLLQELDTRQLPLAVATSSPRDYMEQVLQRFDLLDRFEITFTGDDVTHGKPHPEIYLKTLTQLDVQPCETLVLEDSVAGTQAAEAAGTCVISIPNQHTRDQPYHESCQVAARLDSPEVLQRIWHRSDRSATRRPSCTRCAERTAAASDPDARS